jgi:catechol 2,3-dioxygenase-like lactoylglutathione lyase family enzyme
MAEFPTEDMEITTLLVVSDTERSRDWYRDVLGAELLREYGGSSVVMKFLGHWLLLVTGGGPTKDKPTVEFTPPKNPDRVSTQLTLRVPDCRGAYETLKSRGAEFLTTPVQWEHGEIRAFFRDPDGHLFEISEIVSS